MYGWGRLGLGRWLGSEAVVSWLNQGQPLLLLLCPALLFLLRNGCSVLGAQACLSFPLGSRKHWWSLRWGIYELQELGPRKARRVPMQRGAHRSWVMSPPWLVKLWQSRAPTPPPLTPQPALGTLLPLPGSDDSDYFHQHLSPLPPSIFFPQPPKPIIDQSSFNFRQFPFLLRNLWLLRGDGGWRKDAWASEGMGFSWWSGLLEEVRTGYLRGNLSRSLKDSSTLKSWAVKFRRESFPHPCQFRPHS